MADDELDVCFMLQRVLAGNSNIADSFEDPFLALKRFRAQSYNLVILGIKMPQLYGFLLYRVSASNQMTIMG